MHALWLGALSLGAFLTAAKAHGRQVRLERELAGVWEVVFGGSNPPAVEAIWRLDRVHFWCMLAFSLLASTVYGVAAARFHGKLPPSLADLQAWALLFFAVAWSFILSFFFAGMAAAYRTWRAIQAGRDPGGEWMSSALWGTLGWWGLLIGILALLVWVVRRPMGIAG